MPNARKIIFSTYVIPTQLVEGEETGITHTEFQTSPNGTLGGKGVATINATQWGDDWTSMEHRNLTVWEDYTTVNWEDITSDWETTGLSGVRSIPNTATQLSDEDSDLAFLYLKNTGTAKNALVALDDTGLGGGGSTNGNHYIIVPPGGSVCLRGDGAHCECREISVKASHSDGTTIEYIIAKE
jgi:hypothetical protein